jgi:hypothetical protein
MTAADRMRALHERKKAMGLQQVSLWVPAERVEEIRAIAERMRKERDDAAKHIAD